MTVFLNTLTIIAIVLPWVAYRRGWGQMPERVPYMCLRNGEVRCIRKRNLLIFHAFWTVIVLTALVVYPFHPSIREAGAERTLVKHLFEGELLGLSLALAAGQCDLLYFIRTGERSRRCFAACLTAGALGLACGILVTYLQP